MGEYPMCPYHNIEDYSLYFCSIQKLGQVSQRIFPRTGTLHPTIGDFLRDFGFPIGLLLWGFGLVWLFFAVASTLRTRKFPFNLGWWAFTFPLGVFSTCTNQLGQDIPSRFFRVLGTVCLFTCCAGLSRAFWLTWVLDLFAMCGASVDSGEPIHCARGL